MVVISVTNLHMRSCWKEIIQPYGVSFRQQINRITGIQPPYRGRDRVALSSHGKWRLYVRQNPGKDIRRNWTVLLFLLTRVLDHSIRDAEAIVGNINELVYRCYIWTRISSRLARSPHLRCRRIGVREWAIKVGECIS